MSIEVHEAGKKEVQKWNQYVEASRHGTIFHTLEWLRVVEKNTNSDLCLLTGSHGDETVALFPLFKMRKGPLKMVFSPPPKVAIPFMGPVLVGKDLKGHKMESINIEFLEAVEQFITQKYKPDYFSVHFPLGYQDVRVFKWKGYEVEPLFTYIIELDKNEEKMWSEFKKDLRSDIKKAYEKVEIAINPKGWQNKIYSLLSNRYNDQGFNMPVGKEYYSDISRQFCNKNLEAFIASSDEKILTGILVLHYGNTAYFWMGAPKVLLQGRPVNDLLLWESIRWCYKNGIKTYDLVGANTQRISQFKSKFNPKLVSYFHVKKADTMGKIAETAYLRLSRVSDRRGI